MRNNSHFSRREILCWSAVASTAAAVSSAEDPKILAPIDYGRSFLIGKWPGNQVRFWVESRTRILEEATGRYEDFYQCASCKAEATFAEKNLFAPDNYDFLPIFGPEHGVIFRRKAWLNPDYRSLKKSAEMWDGPVYRVQAPGSCRLLEDNDAIRGASHAAIPVVAQTEIADESTGLRAIMEFPVKTLNIHDAKNLYQVDTGPLAFPDLSRKHETFAESLSLAYVAFNVPHFADFVIEDETPIMVDGSERARVRHFERILSLSARNRLYAVGE